MKNIVQFSGGKDSTAMLHKMLELDIPIDEICFFDTGWEFDSVYANVDSHKTWADNHGVPFTILKPKMSFDFLAFEKEVHHKNGTISNGYSWCGGMCRWGTTEKLKALESYCKGSIEYVGIASDETDRLIKDRKGMKKFLLNDLNMTEADALKTCYNIGVDYNEDGVRLYDILDRGSCFCCGNKNLKELKGMYQSMPEYWNKLKAMQNKTDRLYKKVGVQALEHRFESEVQKELAIQQLEMKI